MATNNEMLRSVVMTLSKILVLYSNGAYARKITNQ